MSDKLVVIEHFTDRSRTQRYQRCNRARWHEYHDGEAQRGIVAKRQSMHLAVGSAFHVGAAHLLQVAADANDWTSALCADRETEAVELALADFDSATADGLEPGYNELPEVAAQAAATAGAGGDGAGISSPAPFGAPVQDSAFDFDGAGLSPEMVTKLNEVQESGAAIFEAYLKAEQRALVEALVRGWARRRLRPLLEQYEVLEVEREGQWVLSEWRDVLEDGAPGPLSDRHRLWWMSRHDGLLLDRASGQIVLQSFKTTGALDGRKLRDAQRDMQGLSEAVEVERRLGEWWDEIHNKPTTETLAQEEPKVFDKMYDWLATLPAPPRIDAVRYEYVLKGERWESKDLSARCGFRAKSQRTPLLQAWVLSAGAVMSAADALGSLKHSFKWTNDLGESKQLYYKNYRQVPVYDLMSVAQWIDLLASGEVQPEARQPGDLGKPQDVLGDQFPPPITVYRNDDELRDWLEQVESQERKVVEDAAYVHAASSEGEKRTRLNERFPQNRQSCSYPGDCEFARGICYSSPDAKRDPLGTGLYRPRTANHPQELAKEATPNE